MKQIKDFIQEGISRTDNFQETAGNYFKEKVKYSLKDWEKWLKLVEKEEFGKNLYIGNYDNDPNITLVYKANDKDKHMDHIATYNHEKGVLYCDDIKLFGNEI